ncbi:UDP-glucuronosyltransferase 2B4 [Trichoplax sp. H2]|nr:UDP-glucuronosyltransferase 2B4 [Trichoplax sp. H2]|eukprot:RDD41366.1 UDP-glucuronosyltransferase 2B4 [Trichoplax sp. H2]
MVFHYFTSILVLMLISCYSGSLKASEIVAVSHHTYSHAIQLVQIGQELVERGHQFTLVVGSNVDFRHDHASTIRIRRYRTILNDSFVTDCIQQFVKGKQNLSSFCITMLNDDCECLLKDRQLLKEISNGTDILITDVTFRCSVIIEDMLKNIPYHVGFSASGFQDPIVSSLYRIPTPPSYIPMMILDFSTEMTFIQRLQNFFTYISADLLFDQIMDEGNQDLWMKYTKIPSLDRNYHIPLANILIMTTSFAIEYARPITPSVKVVGPIIPRQTSNNLTVDLYNFIYSTSSPEFIVISFGSHVPNFQLDIDYELLVLKLSKLPYRIIWKYSGQPLKNQPENVKTMSWIPQNDLLSNPNCKLFVTNAGMSSILEASYYGVPMLAIPLFGDQAGNAQRVQVAGIGKVLSLSEGTVNELLPSITNVIHDPIIKENSKRIASLMQYKTEKTISGIKEAANWIEYAQLHDNAKHLRVQAFDMPWYQRDSIDIWFSLVAIIIIFYIYFFYFE